MERDFCEGLEELIT